MLEQHKLFNDKTRTLLLFTLLCSITIAQSLTVTFRGIRKLFHIHGSALF